MKKVLDMLADEAGASAAEYALILSLIGSAIIFAGFAVGDAVAGSMNDAGNCIETTGENC